VGQSIKKLDASEADAEGKAGGTMDICSLGPESMLPVYTSCRPAPRRSGAETGRIYEDEALTSRICRIEGAKEGSPHAAGPVFMRFHPLPLWWRSQGVDGLPLRHVPALARRAGRLCRRQAGR